MARIKLSSTVSDIRGKVGGSVFQQTGSGLILKNKSNNINTRSNSQFLKKHLTANVSYKWLDITQADRDYWVQFVKFNKYNQKNNSLKFISGQQLFQKYNNYRVYQDLPILIRPAYFRCEIQDIMLTVKLVGGNLILTSNRPLVSANEFLTVFMSIGVRATINNPGNRLRVIKFVQTSGTSWNVSNSYRAVFGYVPPPGESIFLKWCVIHKQTAQIFPFKQTKTKL